MRDWSAALEGAIVEAAKGDARLESFIRANVESVKQLLRGAGPDDATPTEGAGACMVFNISCTHVRSLCNDSQPAARAAYKNTYDLNKASTRRQLVDETLEAISSARGIPLKKEKIYFAALETTGTGIRFFGDMSLVMRYRPDWETPGKPAPASSAEQTTLILERNSFDLVRAPLQAQIDGSKDPDSERQMIAAEWLGSWSGQLLDMVALRILRQLPIAERRWTSGQIARAILDDEDYTEVLFPRSFDVGELAEVRVSAADAAAEADIANRERAGEGPAQHELDWRRHRRDARKAFAAARIPVRVVTTSGRVRSS